MPAEREDEDEAPAVPVAWARDIQDLSAEAVQSSVPDPPLLTVMDWEAGFPPPSETAKEREAGETPREVYPGRPNTSTAGPLEEATKRRLSLPRAMPMGVFRGWARS